MKIGVIADTHIPDKFHRLSAHIKSALEGVDLILHCGDVVEMNIIDELKAIAPVEAVAGNHDVERGLALPRKKVLELEGYRIGMIHGDDLHGQHVTKSQLKEWLFPVLVEPFICEDGVDIIVFGHYHKPVMESFRTEFFPGSTPGKSVKRSVLVFNPGMPVRGSHFSCVGVIDLTPREINVGLRMFNFCGGE